MWTWLVTCTTPSLAEPVRHRLDVRLDPAEHRVSVTDTLEALPEGDGRTWRFALHAGLAPAVRTRGWTLTREAPASDARAADPTAAPVETWILRSKKRKPRLPVVLDYAGAIDHPPEQVATEYQRSFAETPGAIGPDGVYLAKPSYWLPTFGDTFLRFDLTVTGLPAGWDAVTHGQRTEHEPGRVRFASEDPLEEVILVAGPWHERSVEVAGATGPVTVRTMLRADEPTLANRYLQATRRYLKMYETLLPAYPYPSFTLVENFWETGYGMPGFTLLGPEVVRFPFILTSSYPHEILHNWWGNSAYVDPARGNWCEGLTAYLADHLLSEQRGEGATHRRNTLQRYADFVDGNSDFPLAAFGGRDSAASEAVGYGKALMLFHMVRRAIGDEAFTGALRRFYEDSRFRRVSYAEFAAAVTAETGTDWAPFFEAWTTRTGAPVLALSRAEVEPADGGWVLHVTVEQTQGGEPFPLQVPVAVTVEGDEEARIHVLDVGSGSGSAALRFDQRPLRVDVDPAFDVMRRLDPLEVPPAVSTLLGGRDATFVVPAGAPAAERAAWEALAAAWAKPGAPNIVTDAEPVPGGNVWVLGWDNRAAPAVLSHLQGVGADGKGVTIEGRPTARAGSSVVLIARSPADPGQALGWVAADPVDAIPGLARKIPHYTRYSHLVFTGAEPSNTGKGVWEPTDSPLARKLGEGAAALVLPDRPALVALPGRFEADAILASARTFADPALGGRGAGTPGLEQATTTLIDALRAAGLQPAGSDGFRQPFALTGGEPERELAMANVIAEVPGTDRDAAPVLVLAHLDHLGTGWPDVREGNAGQVHPGADDNASGVAVALELARVLAAEPPRARAVRFVFTSGEEADLAGARHLLGKMGERRPFACVNLDTVGRLGDGKVQVIGADSAREWRFVFMGIGYTTGIQTAIVTEPLASSDHAACHEAGVPGVQLFSGPNADYHRPSDTADKLDAAGMAKIADVTYETVTFLAERTDPLTVQLAGDPRPAGAPAPDAGKARTASLGTMPDFTFAGPGVRVAQVGPGSPAEQAGIVAGDVILALSGTEVADLRAYSDALKAHQPGDKVEVRVLRAGKPMTVRATLGAR